MENRNGLPVRTIMSQADGAAERDAALLMASKIRGNGLVTLGGDKNYGTRDFVATLREMKIAPHLAQNEQRPGGSAIDARTTRHTGYQISQQKGKRVEQSFGWMKTIGLLKKVKLRGIRKISWSSGYDFMFILPSARLTIPDLIGETGNHPTVLTHAGARQSPSLGGGRSTEKMLPCRSCSGVN
jgi:hypothetical protein